MGNIATVLVIVAMIGVGIVMIQLANARHATLPAVARPHRWLHRPTPRTPTAKPREGPES